MAFLLGVAVSCLAPQPAFAQSTSFDAWVRALWPAARAKGVSSRTFNNAFRNITPDEKVLKSASRQPEFTQAVWDYLDRAVSEKRVADGKAKLAAHRRVLRKIERKFGVDRHVVVAIWGLESSYGGFAGNKNVIRSLATLAYQGRRSKFGRQQLLAALQILQNKDVTPDKMLGSWAGAMGHTQFIPTTYNAFAVDFDGDGKRDIWSTIPDALGSTANYLKASKWRTNAPWGYEVVLPKAFNFSQADLSIRKPVIEWVVRGVRRADGRKFAKWARRGSIILPAGARGPAFIVFGNFRSILRYNQSISYALAIAHLAERFKGRGVVKTSWPRSDRPLSSKQKLELQKLLVRAGFRIGNVDGRFGPATRRALRQYQLRSGVTPDGHPSLVILERLRRNG